MSKQVGIFADVANLFYCINKRFSGRKLDYEKFRNKALDSEQLYRAFAYGTQIDLEAVKFIDCLKHFQYTPKFKKPRQNENRVNWSVGIAVDIFRIIDRIDIVVIGSSDNDLIPLIEWLKERGRSCVILASGISRDLKDIADRWCEIDESLLEEIKTQQETKNENGTSQSEQKQG